MPLGDGVLKDRGTFEGIGVLDWDHLPNKKKSRSSARTQADSLRETFTLTLTLEGQQTLHGGGTHIMHAIAFSPQRVEGRGGAGGCRGRSTVRGNCACFLTALKRSSMSLAVRNSSFAQCGGT